MPALPEPQENIVNLDGAQWIVEGVKNGQYHVVDRWSPDAPDPVRAIGLLALRLGRVKLHRGEIY